MFLNSFKLKFFYLNFDSFTANVKESLVWLEHNEDPLDDLKQHWSNTAEHRFQSLVRDKTEGKLLVYLHKYPVLKDPTIGPQLNDIDFNSRFELRVNIYAKWDAFFEKFEELAFNLRDEVGYPRILRNVLTTENLSPRELLYKHFNFQCKFDLLSQIIKFFNSLAMQVILVYIVY